MKHYGKSPVRISLCNGGDTDYYIKSMKWGNLINATLDTQNYICEVENKNHKNQINYTYINRFHNKNILYKIESLDQKNMYLNLLTTTIKEICPKFKGSIKIITNVPEKSGLGGSSSLVVSLIKALTKMQNEKITPEDIAKKAYKIERIILGIKGGYQDQWAAAFGGGVNYLEFKKDEVFIEPLWLHEKLMKQIEDNLLLFYLEPRTGNSSNTHEKLAKSFKKNKGENLKIMMERRDNVLKTRNALLKGDFLTFSSLLNEEQRKKDILNSNATTSKSRVLYNTAISAGALAGKISGAGEGGCAFFICKPEFQSKVIRNMESLGAKYIPIKLERLNKMGEI